MASRCKGLKVAIYYFHNNQISFPGPHIGCNSVNVNVNADVFEQRENYNLRPDYFADVLPERPASHFWRAGDSHIDQTFIPASTTRWAFDPNGEFNNCDKSQIYNGSSEVDAQLELSQTDEIINVDITTTSASECWDWTGTPGTEWNCVSSITYSQWSAEYDFKISAATNLNLNLNFNCSGANMTDPGNTVPSIFQDISYYAMRRNTAGESIPTNRDINKVVFGPSLDCNNDNPTVTVQQLFEFDAPETPGDVERIIIVVYGSVGTYGNEGNIYILNDPGYQPPPMLGNQSNVTTMQGTVQLVPAN